MKSVIVISFTILSFLLPAITWSQGCSDAGFCTINSLKPDRHNTGNNTLSNHIKLGASYGKADHDIKITGGFLEYHKDISSKSSIDVKINFLAQKNDLASSSGLSDLFINANWSLNNKLKAITGCKLALSDGNNDDEGNYLPMDFQPSLGTFDLILGLAYELNEWQFFLAAQMPLNDSKNKFLADSSPANLGFRDFQSTNNYKRKGDILLRVAYPIYLSNKITMIPSVLPIYHLGDDEFTNGVGETVIITDSKGVTLNANLFIDYSLNDKNKISLSFGAPVAVRKVRPDGLTRKYIAGLEYMFRF